jgi:FixJ family two-component response regulator
MDGYTLFRKLKALNLELPIIISSGFGDTVVTTRIPSAEIAGLVSKPYRFDQLRVVLKGATSAPIVLAAILSCIASVKALINCFDR